MAEARLPVASIMAAFESPLTALLAALLLQHALLSLMWPGGALLRLARRPAMHWGSGPMRLTLGIGAAVVSEAGQATGQTHEQALAALHKRADTALYAAMAQDHDRLVFSDPG